MFLQINSSYPLKVSAVVLPNFLIALEFRLLYVYLLQKDSQGHSRRLGAPVSSQYVGQVAEECQRQSSSSFRSHIHSRRATAL